MYYAGIGSRITPPEIGEFMTDIAKKLDSIGYTLRSGGADGADTYFERGATNKDIYLGSVVVKDKRALESVDKYHPYPSALKPYARNLMARNCLQILGPIGSNRSQFVVCWTRDGCTIHQDRKRSTGGTGQAISIASDYGIPVFNLKREDHYNLWYNWVYKHGPFPIDVLEMNYWHTS